MILVNELLVCCHIWWKASSAHGIVHMRCQFVDSGRVAAGRLDHHSVGIVCGQMLKGIHLCYRREQDAKIARANAAIIIGNPDDTPACAVVRGIDGDTIPHFEPRFTGSIFAEDDGIAVTIGKPAASDNLPLVELRVQLHTGQLGIAPACWHLILAQFFYLRHAGDCREHLLKSAEWLRIWRGNHHIKVISAGDLVEERIE